MKTIFFSIILSIFSELLKASDIEIDSQYKEIKKPTLIWLHAGNDETKRVLENFKKELCYFIEIQEFNSIESLKSQEKLGLVDIVVTEMGFWTDQNKTSFDKEAGLLAMDFLSKNNFSGEGKFVISQRVGKNEDNLLERSKERGYNHTYNFEPIIKSLSKYIDTKENRFYDVISLVKQSLEQKPIIHPNGYDKYPISNNFKIEKIYYIKNKRNKEDFKIMREELKNLNHSTDKKWGFHGSHSEESTFSIIKNHFDINLSGNYSGNRGCYGEGIYFSTRAYLPIYIASVVEKPHFMFFACKILLGKENKISCLSNEEIEKGVPINLPFNSHVSSNGLEIVIPNKSQILPYFLIKFSLSEIDDKGFISWKRVDGSEKNIRNLYSENQPMNSFV